ncbi:MAG: amidohydrolase, partial [Anaerolineaceae bacterium]|nr:amidohydrolase [Anaerolineaceae bacterium]
MNKTLLFNAGILAMNPERHQYHDGAILIQDDRILEVGKSKDLIQSISSDVEKIDLRGRWILPGLINTHSHTSQQLGRGL